MSLLLSHPFRVQRPGWDTFGFAFMLPVVSTIGAELPAETQTYPMRRVRRAPSIAGDDRKWLFHHELRVDLEAGVGLESGQGADPQVMLRWSDNGGHTWSKEHWTSAGKIGQYKRRAIWRVLGRSRNRIYEVSMSDPVKAVLIDAEIKATPGLN